MKKKKILLSLLIFLILLFISIIIFVVINNNSVVKYDDYKISKISNYLKVNSMIYNGLQENLKTSGLNIKIDDIDDIEINKMIAAYVVFNVASNSEYSYDNCNSCYRYFSKDDNIRFYNVSDVEKIYNELFDGEFKRITQEDIIDFNVLYYNSDIDKYYINVVYNFNKPSIIFEYKGYENENDMLYLDYYYSSIMYDETIDKNDAKKIYLCDINGNVLEELDYGDIFNGDNVLYNYDDYIDYFNIIRYGFKYNKKANMYEMIEISFLEK